MHWICLSESARTPLCKLYSAVEYMSVKSIAIASECISNVAKCSLSEGAVVLFYIFCYISAMTPVLVGTLNSYLLPSGNISCYLQHDCL